MPQMSETDKDKVMDEKTRWARKVSQTKIRRLYLTDARGIVDEELIDEVGTALYARCQSVMVVSRAQALCPRCGHIFPVGKGRSGQEEIKCPAEGCSWQTTYEQWHHSWRHQDLIGTNAAAAFETYLDKYSQAQSPREKLLLIDQLLHTFHQGLIANLPHRSAANNLIEGNHQQVIAFLDELTYGDESTPSLKEQQAIWREQMKQVERIRRPKPGTE
jgi:hypothetical protein